MGKSKISTPFIVVNNDPINYKPNSLKFTEGLGEYKIETAIVGGGQTETIFSENPETRFSKVMFEMHATAENIEKIREWKANKNTNAIEIPDNDTGLSRFFGSATLVTDYEVAVGADGSVSLEFHCDPAS